MRYWTIIEDRFEACPGETILGPFGTYKEAQWAGEHEMKAAAELFTDGRSQLSVKITAR